MKPFAERAAPRTLPEKLDTERDPATLTAYLASLATVNRASLGHRPTVRFADRVAARRSARPLRLLDVGCGHGDTLRAVARRYAARRIRADLIGADLNPVAVAAARAATGRYRGVSLRFVECDARALAAGAAGGRFDAIICSLFTHHLEDDEVVALLRWMDGSAHAFFINDLYRSRLAAAGFRLIATATARHPHVRHDGPISFARAFRRADWQRLLARAGVRDGRIFIGAPFRLCVEAHRD